jgi:hypothetical protein
MKSSLSRRNFLKKSAATGLALGLGTTAFPVSSNTSARGDIKVGVIGLDTSHSIAFTKIINNPENPEMKGYTVTAAYPYGSRTLESSFKRIPGYIEDIRKLGVEIVDSIDSLLKAVDVVLLETNDGNLHLEQALEVFKAGKLMFIDKPAAASLEDTIAIYNAAREYNLPVFSSSSLRWTRHSQEIRRGELVGRVIGADTYGPSAIEPSHIDLAWYGIHGVEMLFTVMGTGCKEVVRVHHPDNDIVVGNWGNGRMGTFRGIRSGRSGYGGTAFGAEGISEIGPYEGYDPLVTDIIRFFETGVPPVSPQETIEIFAFMEAADESRRNGGSVVKIETVMQKAQGRI